MTTVFYTLSLHDALPIFNVICPRGPWGSRIPDIWRRGKPHLCRRFRSEEHTSELQSRSDLVCRLLLEKKNLEIVEQSNTEHNFRQGIVLVDSVDKPNLNF